QGLAALRDFGPARVGFGTFTSLWLLRSTVRMSASHPKATESLRSGEMTLTARTGLMQCSKGLLFRQAPPSANQLSLEQSRGVIRFSAAYFAAISLTIGSVTLSLAVYQSEMTFHALPSHC